MQHFRTLDDVSLQGVWLTIGSFDGVHLGHQKIIKNLTAKAHASGALAVVLTFYPHPAEVLRKRDFAFYLTSPEVKAALLGQYGVDVVITQPFTVQTAATPAHAFMEKLADHLGLVKLHIGYDFALGKNRAGTSEHLNEIGRSLGFGVEQIPPLEHNNHIVSSSRIRFLLGAGLVEEAAALLGRNFRISAPIILGDQRGRTIGFPTANLDIWKMHAIPAAGVYACRAEILGDTFNAVTNIGVRPTFESLPVPPRVEVHLLDFQGDIYGESLQLEFVSRLRGEKRFSAVDDLIAQIKKDVVKARNILA